MDARQVSLFSGKAEGENLLEPRKTKKVLLELDTEIYKEVKKYSVEIEEKISHVVENALVDYLKEQQVIPYGAFMP